MYTSQTRQRLLNKITVAGTISTWLILTAGWFVLPSVGQEVPNRSVSANAFDHKALRLKSKTIYLVSPKRGAKVSVDVCYTQAQGLEMACTRSVSWRSDTAENLQRRVSPDNGKTWSDWKPIDRCKVETAQGMHRQYPASGWVDPSNGRMLTMVLDGVLPNDNPLEGMTHWSLRYRVSTDGGRSFAVDEPVIQKGNYTAEHPVDGVWVGKNSIMMGTRPILTRQGRILVPVQITPLGPDGHCWNPAGGYTYHDAAVLIGQWTEGLKIDWELSERVTGDPFRSTRGCLEPAIAEMPDGQILMVCRGSNDINPKLPAYKWYSVSSDGGRHWSQPPKPWTYSDGSNFFSPSSISRLLKHSNGKIYWIGNISPRNPSGNSPRYPLIIGQVDPDSLLLIKETVTTIDTKGSEDDDSLQICGNIAYEDRQNGDIVVIATRFMSTPRPWRGDSYIYRIEP